MAEVLPFMLCVALPLALATLALFDCGQQNRTPPLPVRVVTRDERRRRRHLSLALRQHDPRF